MSVSNVDILIIAAGSSSRMGASKQLLDIEGEPLLIRTIKAALDSMAREVFVVLGSEFVLHRESIQHLPVVVLHNETWSKGMGNSIKVGVNHVMRLAHRPDALIISVCDQPHLTSQFFNRLIAEHEKSDAPVVAAAYAGDFGVPVLFSKEYFSKLMEMDDEHGAKQFLRKEQKQISTVDFPLGAIDLDTRQDYENFLQK